MRRRHSLLVIAALLLAGTSSAFAAGSGTENARGLSAPGVVSLPTIGGIARDGSTLTASPGEWTGPSASYAYQWQRCGSTGAACSAISGASLSTYLLATVDTGATLRVTVTASNKNGSTIASSAPTPVIAPRVPASTSTTPTTTTATTATTATTTTATTTTATTTTATTTTATTTTATTTTGTTTTAPSTSDPPYLNWDFGTGDLSQIPRLHDVWNGDTPATYRATVQSYPASPSTASRSAKIVTFNGQSSSSTTGDLSMLDDVKGRPWEAEGQTTWYRLDVLFPSGGNAAYPGSFTKGSDSGFNKFLTWHENGFSDGYAAPASSAYFVHTSSLQPFRFDFVGGDGRGASTVNGTATNPGTTSWISALDLDASGNSIPLQKDHWYRIVSQIKWSRTAGWAKIWVDGRLAFPNPQHRLTVPYNGSYSIPATFPTLWWDYTRNTSGRIWMMAGHYRKPKATWTDTIYMANIRVGPSQASVG
jgi:hypothetical protein